MSDNEEPVTATELDGTDQIIDLDDVEGHGLREVAAGLGAAAVLVGGGTAAAATIGVHPSLPGGPDLPTVQSVVQASDRIVDGGVTTVRAERDATSAQADRTAGGAGATVARAATGVEATADAFVDAGRAIAADQAREATRLATQARAGLTATADAFVDSASRAAATTGSTASGAGATATGSADDAARKVATVTQLTITDAEALVTSIRINVTEVTPSAGVGASGQDMSGFVSVDLGGSNVLRVELQNGEATITLKPGDLVGKVLSVTYSGDAMHASSLRSLAF